MSNKRRDEIKRLIFYAKGMGLKVFFRKYKSHYDAAAYTTTDIKEITVYINKNQSKTETILLLIHELAHVVQHIHELKREPDTKYDEAYSNLEIDSTKKNRKVILDSERAGIKWWNTVILDCNIQLSKSKIEYQKEFDLWQYEFWYENDCWPTRKQTKIKRQELRKKYYG